MQSGSEAALPGTGVISAAASLQDRAVPAEPPPPTFSGPWAGRCPRLRPLARPGLVCVVSKEPQAGPAHRTRPPAGLPFTWPSHLDMQTSSFQLMQPTSERPKWVVPERRPGLLGGPIPHAAATFAGNTYVSRSQRVSQGTGHSCWARQAAEPGALCDMGPGKRLGQFQYSQGSRTEHGNSQALTTYGGLHTCRATTLTVLLAKELKRN